MYGPAAVKVKNSRAFCANIWRVGEGVGRGWGGGMGTAWGGWGGVGGDRDITRKANN